MAIGLLGIGYGFLMSPKDTQEVEEILAGESGMKIYKDTTPTTSCHGT
jgi:hypothetical protein